MCKQTDEKCLISTGNTIMRMAAANDGIPGLGFPNLNPLRVEEIIIKQNPDSPVNIKITVKNLDATGVGLGNITKMR